MMVNVQTDILINRSRAEVAKYAADPDNAPRTAQGPFPMQTSYTWTDDDGGTRMTLGNTGSPSGFSKLAGLVMAPMIRRKTRKDPKKAQVAPGIVKPQPVRESAP